MATWYGRDVTGAGVWFTANQTKVSGPSVTIAGSIQGVTGAADVSSLAPTTLTASANLLDSAGNNLTIGLKVIVMQDLGDSWSEVAEVTVGASGVVQYTDTLLPPHPNYIFVVPRQTGNLVETVVTPAVTPV